MLFIFDSDLNVVDTLSNEGSINDVTTFYDDEFYKNVASGAETYTFKTLAGSDEAENLIVGNYIAFRDNKGDYKLFDIINVEETHDENFEKTVYCEMNGIELLNDIVRPTNLNNCNVEKLAKYILAETNWELGYIDDFTDNLDISIDSHIKAYNAIQQYIVGEFGVEIYFTIEMSGNKVTHKYLNIVEKRGNDAGYRFSYSSNIERISRTVDASDLCTALIGEGNDGLTFSSIEADDKPLNQDYIANETALKNWSKKGNHIMGIAQFDTDDAWELLNLTRKELASRCNPKVTYEMNAAFIDDDLDIGDIVTVTDFEFNPPITLQARVTEITTSFSDPTKNTCVISNFVQVYSNITQDMRNVANSLKGYVNDSKIENITKGGYLSSDLLNENGKIKIDNSNKSFENFCFDIDGKSATRIFNDISPGKLIQNFIVDYYGQHVYVIYNGSNDYSCIVEQRDLSGKLLGTMTLNSFGHGNSVGMERDFSSGKTYLWFECRAQETSSGSFRGTRVCRFEFKNGTTATNTYGKEFNLLPGYTELQLAVDSYNDKIVIRGKSPDDSKFYYKIFVLSEVLAGKKRVIGSFLSPKTKGVEGNSSPPLQGFDIQGNYIYAIQGAGYYFDTPLLDTYVTCIDLKGNVRYQKLIPVDPTMKYREAEGIKVIRNGDKMMELWFCLVEGFSGERKSHLYKYVDNVYSQTEPKGNFIHPNGWMDIISDAYIAPSSDEKAYLMYICESSRFEIPEGYSDKIILASYKNGSWYYNNEKFDVMTNDCIIGYATANKDSSNSSINYTIVQSAVSTGSSISSITSNSSTNGIWFEQNGVVIDASRLGTGFISANVIDADTITADMIAADSIKSKHISAEAIEAIEVKVDTLIANNATISELKAAYAEVDEILAGNINADNISTEFLTALKANIETAIIGSAEIKNLISNYAEITDLLAGNINADNISADYIKTLTAQIENAVIGSATINDLSANYASIAELLAGNITADNISADFVSALKLEVKKAVIDSAEIKQLTTEIGSIKTLVNGQLTSENIQAGGITSDRLTIADAFIQDAMIGSINASKIQAGELNTSLLKIRSEDGGLVIAGNTQQFLDENNVVRIQMGKDASGHFSFGIFDSTGRGTLIDANGIKEKALSDGIIKDRMISNGEISGSKIDINSLVTEINNGTEIIKGSKVELDTSGQTLEVAFNEIKNSIDYSIELVSSNGEAFRNGNIDTTIKAIVKYGSKDVTNEIAASKFIWTRVSDNSTEDAAWNKKYKGCKEIHVTSADVTNKAKFNCEIDI